MSLKLVSGPYTTRQLLDNVRAVEDSISDELRFHGPTTDPVRQRDMNNRLSDITAGKNVVIYNKAGFPSIMVHLKAVTLSELGVSEDENFHPAFNRSGNAVPQLYIAKYQAYVVEDQGTKYALSLRGKPPTGNVRLRDYAMVYAHNNNAEGKTEWHVMTNAEWAMLALVCKANAYWPRGNNDFSADYYRGDERGEPILFSGEDNRASIVATGTGPKDSSAWSHDGTPFGVWDLNGNIQEYVTGVRLVNGEIQIIPQNNASDPTLDQGEESTEWRAILQDGSLVAPGTEGTLKYNTTNQDGSGNVLIDTVVTGQSDGSTYASQKFKIMSAASGVQIPPILRHLCLAPLSTGYPYKDDYYLVKVTDGSSRCVCRGGTYRRASGAGVNAAYIMNSWQSISDEVGFRTAFIPEF